MKPSTSYIIALMFRLVALYIRMLFKSSYLIKDSFPTKMDAKFFGHLLQKYLGELQCTNNDLQVPRGKHAGNLAEEGQEWSLMLF